MKGQDKGKFYSIARSIIDPDNLDSFDPVQATKSQNLQEAADKISDYFTNIVQGFRVWEWNGQVNVNELVSQKEVDDAIKQVKIKNSRAIGDFHPKVMKKHIKKFRIPILIIINSCITSGKWPKIFKLESAIPIPKVNSPENIDQIRLIFNTPLISKIMEKVVHNRILRQTELKRNESQKGAKKGIGTVHAIAEVIHKVYEIIENPKTNAIAVFFDFSKAFNCGHRDQMIQEYQRLGLTEPNLNLVKSFLSDRKMSVKIGDTKSRLRPSTSGSPQGSVLGQDCWLINNDLYDLHFPKSTFRISYIDDSMLIESMPKNNQFQTNNVNSSQRPLTNQRLQKAVEEMENFSDSKDFKLNEKKTVLMQFGNVSQNSKVDIKLKGQSINEVTEFKYLGIWLDQKLNLDTHVEKIAKKASKRIWLLRKLRYEGIKAKELVIIYKSQIRSILEYGCQALYPIYNNGQLAKLEKVQINALKSIYGFQNSANNVRTLANCKEIKVRFEKLTDQFILKTFKGNKTDWFTTDRMLSS